jgi:hypothetical protein
VKICGVPETLNKETAKKTSETVLSSLIKLMFYYMLFYYMHDKIAFFKIQLHFVKSFLFFCKQFGIDKLGK